MIIDNCLRSLEEQQVSSTYKRLVAAAAVADGSRDTGERRTIYSLHYSATIYRCFRMRCLLAILFLSATLCPTRGRGKDHVQACRYWCRTTDHRYYCCPTGKIEGWMEHAWRSFFHPLLWISADEAPVLSLWPDIVAEHKEPKKHCPPLRTHCPRTYDWHSPPTSCHSDEDCGGWEKCCYDVCLEHRTCKHGE